MELVLVLERKNGIKFGVTRWEKKTFASIATHPKSRPSTTTTTNTISTISILTLHRDKMAPTAFMSTAQIQPIILLDVVQNSALDLQWEPFHSHIDAFLKAVSWAVLWS